MTILNITQANRGEQVYGLKTGGAVFSEHESKCFWFATAPNGRKLKISKKTNRLCLWGSQSTSPVFQVVEFEAEEGDWKDLDDKRMAECK